MTSNETVRHPDVSEISDLAEGALSFSRAADLRLHLDGCALCADVETSLHEIRELLGTLSGPHPMPADVIDRIDEALAAEAHQALPGAAAPEAGAHVSRETAPAAPAGEPVTNADRPAGHPRATTGPGRNSRARRRRHNIVIGAGFAAATIGLGVLLLQSARPTDSEMSVGDSGVSATKKSATEFSESALEDRVQKMIAKQPLAQDRTAEGGPSLESEPNSPKRGTAVDVPPCVQVGTGRTTVPIAAQVGTYDGKFAFLVILPHATDPTRVQAFVVDASCVDATQPAKGEVLLTKAYPRR
ncbi:hypothetical protein [Streptomyces hypolithicus]